MYARNRVKKVIENLKRKLELEEGRTFYRCHSAPDHVRVTIEEAAGMNFQCPICKAPLWPEDEKVRETLKRIIDKLESMEKS